MAENTQGESQIAPRGVANPLRRKEIFETFGDDGVKNFDGYIYQDYNLQFANNRTASLVYDKMRKGDAQVNATLQAMYLPILTTEWKIKPATYEDGSTDDFQKEVAEFVQYNLFECIDFYAFLSQALLNLPFGYSVFEKIFTVDAEGKITLKELAYRYPETILRWKTQDGAPGVTQSLNAPAIEGKNEGDTMLSIPAEKLLIFTNQKEGNNYQGTSVLRSAYKHWLYKDRFYRFDAIRQERESVGLPIIWQPRATDEDTQAELEEILQGIRVNEKNGVIMPGSKADGWDFTFATAAAGGDRTALWESVNHHNQQISRNVLAMFLDAGSNGNGSFALSENQSNVFMLSLEAWAKTFKGIVNRYAIKQLVDLNFQTDGYYPTLENDKIGNIDLQKLATALTSLAGAGYISPDESTESYLRDVFNLPPKMSTEGEEETKGEKEKKEPPEPPTPEEEKKAEEEKEMKDLGSEDEDWREFAKVFSNRTLIELQNELSAEDMEALKKKGLKFNAYEDQAWRPLTFAERKVNFTLLQNTMQKYTRELNSRLNELGRKQKSDLLNQIKSAVEKNDVKALGEIKIKYKGEVSQVVTNIQKEVFEAGKKSAAAEMGVKVPPTKKEVQGAMRVQTDAVVAKTATDSETAAKTAVAQHANQRGGIEKLGTGMAAAVASSAIDDAMTKAKNAFATYAIGGAMNTGRASIFERYPEKVFALQYSAILDGRTSDICLSLDGRVFKPGSAAASLYTPPNHMNCRSIMVEILEEEEFKPEVDTPNVLKSIPPVKDLSSAGQMVKPYVKKGSAAIGQIQQEIKRRQDLVDKYKSEGSYENRIADHEAKIKSLQSAIKGKFLEFVKNVILKHE